MTQRRIGVIWAQARGGVIGANGTMPWHVPEDLAFFRATTMGRPVIMGRTTWESLPAAYRPLPGRVNIVVSRTVSNLPGALVASSVGQAFALARERTASLNVEQSGGPSDAAKSDVAAWVIGGAQIYAQAVALADVAVVTEIDLDIAGDAYAPELGDEWTAVASDPQPTGADAECWHMSKSGLKYRFITRERRRPGRRLAG